MENTGYKQFYYKDGKWRLFKIIGNTINILELTFDGEVASIEITKLSKNSYSSLQNFLNDLDNITSLPWQERDYGDDPVQEHELVDITDYMFTSEFDKIIENYEIVKNLVPKS